MSNESEEEGQKTKALRRGGDEERWMKQYGKNKPSLINNGKTTFHVDLKNEWNEVENLGEEEKSHPEKDSCVSRKKGKGQVS